MSLLPFISPRRDRMPVIGQIVVLCAIAALIVVGQIYVPIWATIIVGLGIGVSVLINDWRRVMLVAFTLLVIVVRLQDKGEAPRALTPLDALTGVAIIGSIALIISQSLINRKRLTNFWGMYALFAYIIWAMIGAAISIVSTDATINAAFREFLDFSPLFVFPILVVSVSRTTPRFDQWFFRLLVALWAMVQIAGVLRIRSTLAEATYLFQTGFSHYDIVNAGLMCLLFTGLAALNRIHRRQPIYVLAILASIGGLVMTFNRTSWVAVVICVPILLLLSPTRKPRHIGTRAWLWVSSIIIIGATIAYFTTPIGKIAIEYLGSRIASSSKVGTDISLVNRYVEWRYVLQQIASNPIMGVGFGGLFKVYVWVGGFSIMTGYTHNGLLIVLAKSGVVGTIFFFSAYFGFIHLGWTLRRSRFLTETERMIVTVGFVCLLAISIVALTIGLIMHREVLLYVGIIWGYFLVARDRIAMRERRENSVLTSLPNVQ